MRVLRDDARLLAQLPHLRVLLLLLQPGELARELLTLGVRDGEVEQEAAAHSVADMAIELAEVAEVSA